MFIFELAFAHEDRDGQPLSAEEIAAAEGLVLDTFALTFRGGQAYPHNGSYRNNAGKVMRSASTAIKAYTRSIEGHLASLKSLARDLCIRLNQESIILSWWEPEEGDVLWINPGEPDEDQEENQQHS